MCIACAGSVHMDPYASCPPPARHGQGRTPKHAFASPTVVRGKIEKAAVTPSARDAVTRCGR